MPLDVVRMLAAVATHILSPTPPPTPPVFSLQALLQAVQLSRHLLQLIKDELQ